MASDKASLEQLFTTRIGRARPVIIRDIEHGRREAQGRWVMCNPVARLWSSLDGRTSKRNTERGEYTTLCKRWQYVFHLQPELEEDCSSGIGCWLDGYFVLVACQLTVAGKPRTSRNLSAFRSRVVWESVLTFEKLCSNVALVWMVDLVTDVVDVNPRSRVWYISGKSTIYVVTYTTVKEVLCR